MSEPISISSEGAEFWITGEEWLKMLKSGEESLRPDGWEHSVFAEIRWHGETEIVYSEDFGSCTVQQAAELAVAHLIEKSGVPDKVPVATVYWASGSVFGPFPVDVSLSIEASCLRGGD